MMNNITDNIEQTVLAAKHCAMLVFIGLEQTVRFLPFKPSRTVTGACRTYIFETSGQDHSVMFGKV